MGFNGSEQGLIKTLQPTDQTPLQGRTGPLGHGPERRRRDRVDSAAGAAVHVGRCPPQADTATPLAEMRKTPSRHPRGGSTPEGASARRRQIACEEGRGTGQPFDAAGILERDCSRRPAMRASRSLTASCKAIAAGRRAGLVCGPSLPSDVEPVVEPVVFVSEAGQTDPEGRGWPDSGGAGGRHCCSPGIHQGPGLRPSRYDSARRGRR